MSINDTVSNLNPDRQTKVIVQMRALIQNFENQNPDWETADEEENIEGNDRMTSNDLLRLTTRWLRRVKSKVDGHEPNWTSQKG